MPTEFEVQEGRFHAALGIYNEVVVANALSTAAGLNAPALSSQESLDRMQSVIDDLQTLGDDRHLILAEEGPRIKAAAAKVAALVGERITPLSEISSIDHTGGRNNPGGDLRLRLRDGSIRDLSLKTDKSSKIALSEIGQCSNFLLVCKAFYALDPSAVEALAWTHLKMKLEDAYADYEDVSHLLQWVVIAGLQMATSTGAPPPINNLAHSNPTNLAATKHLFNTVRSHIGQPNCEVIITDRVTGNVSTETKMTGIDIDKINVSDVSLTPSRPTGRYGTTIGVKYKGDTLFTHQVKHERGRNSSTRFSDVTTRVEI